MVTTRRICRIDVALMIRVYVYRLLIREALEFLGAVSKLFEFSDFFRGFTHDI